MNRKEIYGLSQQEILAKQADELLRSKGFAPDGQKGSGKKSRKKGPIIYTPMKCK